MRRSSRYALGGMVLTVLVSSGLAVRFAIATDSLDPQKSIQVTKAEAASTLASFAGLPSTGLRVDEPLDGAMSRFYAIDGPSFSGTVDVHDGHVITLRLAGLAIAADIKTTAGDAITAARAFLDQRAIPYQDLREGVTLLNHGDTNEYVVSWERVVDGVIVPDSKVVGVDAATGRAFRYASATRAYTAPGKPSIDQASAIKLAIAAGDLGQAASVENADLRVAFDSLGAQYLAWQITLSAPIPSAPDNAPLARVLVEVNASSGMATVLGRS